MTAESEALRALAKKFRQQAAQYEGSEKSLLDWGKKYVPHKFTRSFSEFHTTLAGEYDRMDVERGQATLVIAPRGNAKTTITDVRLLKAVCETSEHYIMIISDTEKQAAGILATLKDELENNELIKQDYPLACHKGPVWNTGRIETANGVCIEALGAGQKVRGRKYKQYRPTLIIVDDPDNDDDVRSATTRQSKIEWFDKALIQCGDKETNIIVIGTMIHRECLVGYLEKHPKFKVLKFQAIRQWPVNMQLWEQWEELYIASPMKMDKEGKQERDMGKAERFYDINYDAMNEGAVVLWEEKEDLLALMKQWAGRRASFASEKQNDPRDPSKCEFREEWLANTDYDYDDLQKRLANEDHLSVIVADPAKGGNTKKHDYSPIVVLHYFGDTWCYVEVQMEKIPTTVLTDKLLDWYKALRIGRTDPILGFESNGFQELIGNELHLKAQERGFHSIQVVPIKNYNIHKNTRISRLTIRVERKFFRFKSHCSHTRMLIQQLLDHPNADHDDGPDALETAVRLLEEVSNGQSDPVGEHDDSPMSIY